MKTNIPQNTNNTAHEQAQEWFIKLQAEPDNQPLLDQFKQWLEQEEEHETLYLETCLLWQDMGTATEKVVSSAKEDATKTQGSHCKLETPKHVPKWFSKQRVLSALSVTTLVALVVALLPPHLWYSPDYFTTVGEQQTIRLADGSTLHLNSQSAVNVNYSDSFRSIELLYGEAFFEVAKSKTQPFRVSSQGVIATAVGTAFNVRQLEHEVQTTLTEGKLKVDFPRHNQEKIASLTLEAGQGVSFSKDTGSLSLTKNHELYLPDWKRHLLRLDDVPLSDVVTLLNRHYSQKLVLLDIDRRAEKITGVIPLGDLDLTLKMLNKSLHLEANTLFHRLVLLR